MSILSTSYLYKVQPKDKIKASLKIEWHWELGQDYIYLREGFGPAPGSLHCTKLRHSSHRPRDVPCLLGLCYYHFWSRVLMTEGDSDKTTQKYKI